MPRVTIDQMRQALAEKDKEHEEDRIRLREELALESKLATEAHKRSQELSAENRTLREQMQDLKQKLYEARIENARLNGYLDRVREDDMAREEPIVIDLPDGSKEVRPRRPPPLIRSLDLEENAAHARNMGFMHNGDRKPRVHWTGYGR